MRSDNKTNEKEKGLKAISTIEFLKLGDSEQERYMLEAVLNTVRNIKVSFPIEYRLKQNDIMTLATSHDLIKWFKLGNSYTPCLHLSGEQISVANLSELLQLCNPGRTVIPVALGLCYSFESQLPTEKNTTQAIMPIDALIKGLRVSPINAIVEVYHCLFKHLNNDGLKTDDRCFSYLGVLLGFGLILDVIWTWSDGIIDFTSCSKFCESCVDPILRLVRTFSMPVEAASSISSIFYAFKSGFITYDDSDYGVVKLEKQAFNLDAFAGTEYTIEAFNNNEELEKFKEEKKQEFKKVKVHKKGVMVGAIDIISDHVRDIRLKEQQEENEHQSGGQDNFYKAEKKQNNKKKNNYNGNGYNNNSYNDNRNNKPPKGGQKNRGDHNVGGYYSQQPITQYTHKYPY